MKRLACGAVTLLATALVSGTALAVEDGAEDAEASWAVAVTTGGPSAPDVRCSGSLISPNVVLTTRHCVGPSVNADGCASRFGPPGPAGDLWVTAAPWALPGVGLFRQVASIVVPDIDDLCGNDVALLVLTEPFAAGEATYARPVTSASAFNEVVRARLTGVAAFGATSASASDKGKRRSRFDIPLRCIPGNPAFPCGKELDYIDVRELTTGGGLCPGDSGAGAVVALDHSTIFGVLSRGKIANGACSEGIFERTDTWAWLISRTVIDASGPAVPAPLWASELFPETPRSGEFCRGAGTCGPAAECISLDGSRSWSCVDRCSDTSPCAGGTRCDRGLCVPGSLDAATDHGCAASGAPIVPEHAASGCTICAFALLAALIRLRRRS